MTTLEWLMIVGAVSGLAALAVVLVASLVDETAEQSGSGVTTNRSAAAAAASQIEEAARTFVAPADGGFATWNDWDRHFTARCTRLMVLYSSIELELEVAFAPPYGKGDQEPTAAELAAADDYRSVIAADPDRPTSAGHPAQILCQPQE